MNNVEQAVIIRCISKLILLERSGNWKLFVACRPVGDAGDKLTDGNASARLKGLNNVDFYLEDRIEMYDSRIGIFVDITCEMLNLDGSLKGVVGRLHLGFEHNSSDLIIDYCGVTTVISNFKKEDISILIPQIQSKCFCVKNGFSKFF